MPLSLFFLGPLALPLPFVPKAKSVYGRASVHPRLPFFLYLYALSGRPEGGRYPMPRLFFVLARGCRVPQASPSCKRPFSTSLMVFVEINLPPHFQLFFFSFL